MLALAYYLLKVSACSGLLYGYYLIALRNKRFHQYNRFYLLSAVVLSFIIPLAKIEFWNDTNQQQINAIELLKAVATRDAIVENSLKSASINWNLNLLALIIFSVISATFFIWLITALSRIIILIRTNPNKKWNNINFIVTEVKESPFSFFRYIFWNKNIDLQTEEGNYILQHELTHVNEKHSIDKLFLQIALIIGWHNPFFWLIQKELNMIHEFIADEKAISNGDTSSFSAMLLKAAYPQHAFILTNSFFHSPIKRRLIMFTTSKTTNLSYLRRLMILPLLGFALVFFAFKSKGQNSNKQQTDLVKLVEKKENSSDKIKNYEGADTTIKVRNQKNNPADSALVVVDGVQMSMKEFHKKEIPPEQIKSMNVLKGKSATEKYGDKGANGVIEITTSSKSSNDKIETKHVNSAVSNSDTIEAKFPGGNLEWRKFLETNLDANVAVSKDKAPNGDYTVQLQFIVTETGEIKDIAATKVPDRCPSCAIEAVRVIKTGPKWDPMTIDGEKVTSKQTQFISFRVQKV